MQPRISTPALLTEPARYDDRPSVVETVLRWQDIGGIEGTNLEWMLDQLRLQQEART